MKTFITASFVVVVLLHATTNAAEDWPNWRGPEDNGVAAEAEYPAEWTAEMNVLWKAELPGLGSSTPIVMDGKIFVTSGDGKSGKEARNAISCYAMDGELLWKKNVGRESPGKRGKKGTGANSSPVTDGEHVFVYFKSSDFACFDFKGNQLWHKNLEDEFGEISFVWDLGTSPVLTKDHVLIANVHRGPSYIVAFNKVTGDVVWKVDRNLDAPAEAAESYTTPVVNNQNGREEFYVLGADHVTAHRTDNGEEIWRVGELNPDGGKTFRSIASPLLIGDMLVAPYARGTSITGIRLGGKGDVTRTHVAYTLRLPEGKRNGKTVDVPTPAADGDNVVICADKGSVFSINAKTGETDWDIKVGNPRTIFSASPIIAGDNVYVISEEGTTYVISKSKQKLVAENSIDEFVVATPVLVDGKILLRSDRSLFCIGDK